MNRPAAPSPSVSNDDDDVFSHTPRRQSNPSPRVFPTAAASPNTLALDNWEDAYLSNFTNRIVPENAADFLFVI